MKLTKVQIITIIALIAYLIWEFAVKQWEKGLPESDPVIRADYVLIFPVLGILILVSIYQFIKGRNRK